MFLVDDYLGKCSRGHVGFRALGSLPDVRGISLSYRGDAANVALVGTVPYEWMDGTAP